MTFFTIKGRRPLLLLTFFFLGNLFSSSFATLCSLSSLSNMLIVPFTCLSNYQTLQSHFIILPVRYVKHELQPCFINKMLSIPYKIIYISTNVSQAVQCHLPHQQPSSSSTTTTTSVSLLLFDFSANLCDTLLALSFQELARYYPV